jgi:hypothetical protein
MVKGARPPSGFLTHQWHAEHSDIHGGKLGHVFSMLTMNKNTAMAAFCSMLTLRMLQQFCHSIHKNMT